MREENSKLFYGFLYGKNNIINILPTALYINLTYVFLVILNEIIATTICN